MNEDKEKMMAEFFKNFQARKKIRSEAFYFDANGNSVEKAHAVKVIVREYNENGELINETFATIGEEELEKEEEHRK